MLRRATALKRICDRQRVQNASTLLFEGVYRRKISTSTERITENFFITAFADTPYPPTVLHPHILDGRNYL